MNPVRVRFAPSPTGFLHLGGLRTALYNYLVARANGGQFIVRIEDTDQARLVPGATANILETLAWAGLRHDEGPDRPSAKFGPYIQSQRLDRYRSAADELVQAGNAYKCFCSPERLALANATSKTEGRPTGYDGHCRHLTQSAIHARSGQPYVVRFKVPRGGSTSFSDIAFKRIEIDHGTIEDFVILKSDGWPTYHLASVVDDHSMAISHVMRGHEWLPSTPKHVLLYQAMNWEPPQWVHLPLLLNPARKKLSKRDGENGLGSFVSSFQAKGYHPEALLNFVALLGWSQEGAEEKLTLDQLEKQFSFDRLHVAPAVVDFDRLDWLQRFHFSRQVQSDPSALLRELCDALKLAKIVPDVDTISEHYNHEALKLISSRLHTVADIVGKAPYFWVDPDFRGAEAKTFAKSLKSPDVIGRHALETIRTLEPATPDDFTAAISNIASRCGVANNNVMTALRFYATGSRVGAGIPATLSILGADTVIRRIEQGLECLNSSAASAT